MSMLIVNAIRESGGLALGKRYEEIYPIPEKV